MIVWTDYATLSPFLMTLSILIQVLYRKKVNFRTDLFTFFCKIKRSDDFLNGPEPEYFGIPNH